MRARILAFTAVLIFLWAQSVPVQGAKMKNTDHAPQPEISRVVLPVHPGHAPEKNDPSTFLYLPLILKPHVYPPTCATIPILTGPSDGSRINNLIPLFQWDSGNNPNATEFNMEIWLDPGFTTWVYGLSSGWEAQGAGQWLVNINLDPSTTYYWRAYLMCGSDQGPFSQTWSFTTSSGGTILPGPTLISPADLSLLSGTTAHLQWSPVSGSVEYQVSDSGGGMDSGRILSATQVMLDSLDPNTTYEWWVQGRDDYAWGSESTHWQFTTGASGSTPTTLSMLFVRDFAQWQSRGRFIVLEKSAGR